MSTQNENAGSKSLMKKTKVELVDIILRKDDVEKQLRKEKADIELDFNKAKEMIAKKDTVIKGTENALLKEQKNNAGLESSIDDLTTENAELVSRNNKLFSYVFVESIIIVGLAILCFYH